MGQIPAQGSLDCYVDVTERIVVSLLFLTGGYMDGILLNSSVVTKSNLRGKGLFHLTLPKHSFGCEPSLEL